MDKSVSGIEKYAAEVNLFQKNRDKLLQSFKEAGAVENSVIILQGASDTTVNDTDVDRPFRQDSYFFYAFGVEETDTVGLIEVNSGKTHLFVPRLSENLALYLVIPTPALLHEKYGFEAHYLEDIESVLAQLSPSKVYLNNGKNSDSGISPPVSFFKHSALEKYETDSEFLYPILTECRVIKSPEEVEILRRVALSVSEAHVEIMKNCKPLQREYVLPSILLHHLKFKYGQDLSFPPIAASGNNGSVLHNPFHKDMMQDGQLVVCDMGSFGYGYCSDVTCTIPVGGKYSDKQKKIYEAVLAANRAVFQASRPGVNWTDMHLLAERTLLEKLVEIGIVNGDIDEMLQKRIGGVFMPHGLGHFLGLDTHDVGGYTKGPPRIDELGLRNLRTRRDLEAGMVITIEPGCYFIDFAINSALEDPEKRGYFNVDVLNEFRGFGGVRIEDDVLITETGAECLNNVPRDVSDVEAVMAGGEWPIQ